MQTLDEEQTTPWLDLARSRAGVALVVCIALVGLIVLADTAVLSVLLLLLAALLILLLVIAAAATVLLSIGTTPDWMLDTDGRLPGIPARVMRLVSHTSMRLRSRSSRPADKLVSEMQKQIMGVVWTDNAGSTAYSHLLVELHPETVERVDAWMEVQDICARLAQRYAKIPSRTKWRSESVVVTLAGYDGVPPGRIRISGSFKAPEVVGAVAWARAPHSRPVDGAAGERGRKPAALQSPPVGATRMATMTVPATVRPIGSDAESTRVLPPRTGSAGLGEFTVALPTPAAASESTVAFPAVPGPGESTVALPPPAADSRPATLSLQPCAPDGRPLPGSLAHTLAGDLAWTIGRAPHARIHLDDSHISRDHAQIKATPRGWVITDTNSTTGTTVNGERIRAGSPVVLRAGDVIEIGSSHKPGAARVIFRVDEGTGGTR